MVAGEATDGFIKGLAELGRGCEDGGRDDLDTGHAVAQEGAGGLDMRNVVCVAEATAAKMGNNYKQR